MKNITLTPEEIDFIMNNLSKELPEIQLVCPESFQNFKNQLDDLIDTAKEEYRVDEVLALACEIREITWS